MNLRDDVLAQAYKDHAQDPKEQTDTGFWDEAFLEDAKDLYALRKAKNSDNGEHVSIADVKKQLDL